MARCKSRHVCPSSQTNFTSPLACSASVAFASRSFSCSTFSAGRPAGLAIMPRMRNGRVTVSGCTGWDVSM